MDNIDNYPDIRFNNNITTSINYLIVTKELNKDSFVDKKILKTTQDNKAKLTISIYKNNVQIPISNSKLKFDSDGYLILNA